MRRGSPLPIPNREVKPDCADGTAVMWESMSLPFFKNPSWKHEGFLFYNGFGYSELKFAYHYIVLNRTLSFGLIVLLLNYHPYGIYFIALWESLIFWWKAIFAWWKWKIVWWKWIIFWLKGRIYSNWKGFPIGNPFCIYGECYFFERVNFIPLTCAYCGMQQGFFNPWTCLRGKGTRDQS